MTKPRNQGWRCGSTAEPSHVPSQRRKQQMKARLAESSPVRRVCSWHSQLRCSSTYREIREVGFMATTSTFLRIDRSGKFWVSKYKVRESHRFGFGKPNRRTAVALNRIIVLGASEGCKVVQLEPITRHIQLILKSLRLLKSSNAGSTQRTR